MVVVPGPETPGKWVKNAPKVLGTSHFLEIDHILHVELMIVNPMYVWNVYYKFEQWSDIDLA